MLGGFGLIPALSAEFGWERRLRVGSGRRCDGTLTLEVERWNLKICRNGSLDVPASGRSYETDQMRKPG